MPNVCESDIASAHKYREKFCQNCEALHNLDLISPNMHLHFHLQDTICDFGPVYGYWLFSFERYNSILKNIKSNRKTGFELTYARQFVEDVHKQDIISRIMESSDTRAYMDIFQKITKYQQKIASTITSYSHFFFSLANFITATLEVSILIKGNEPLPSTAFPLAKKSLSLMPTPGYNCLIEYYQGKFIRDVMAMDVVRTSKLCFKKIGPMRVMAMSVKFNTSLCTHSPHQQPLSHQLATTTNIPLLSSDGLKQHQIRADNFEALKSTTTTSTN
ncbi:hypothetical protein PHYBLDRAFT_70351 [Phycomyces blakesleeanus NRRL 1555(-)]|uniref:Uncharacterized protein n=1 Tax=Phycomyces blakesleeanus (strain ATCC 8743b / DSM 1359 / FGSC 10004 / NBRC 33097 / NRRL 1555) TaxID=763407 RepID=A0A167JZS8_PHYB8|nr:hypothetical protein PHYBLDRAFT_70351 [Phycomyces blakesleeanus NRRL 1555(-)]OAD66996.1 hypothetical protein PHYBLDRAFT_70351 [Phycomyces blakesleeanus NRRL 1555(-)]|eukprot:XP_018285036.1 hypothetical protein PHYBLDRAFT_70351 [Phycomyces blakesleeanus NRRL 1555(-)]